MKPAREAWNAFWARYFEPRPFERAGNCRVYRLLGIRFFKHFLPTSGDLVSRWRGVSRIRRTDGGAVAALRRYERQTRSYECRHIFGALSMLVVSWWAITIHGKGNWLALLAANLVINGYPIMLQRYNRVRLQNALAHLEAFRSSRERDRDLMASSRPAASPPDSGAQQTHFAR